MSDDKKQEGGSVTFLNRGQRSFDLGNGRRHAPGATMAYTLDEAKRMEPYAKELVDITKLPGQVDSAKLKADNAGLLSENAGGLEEILVFMSRQSHPRCSVTDGDLWSEHLPEAPPSPLTRSAPRWPCSPRGSPA